MHYSDRGIALVSVVWVVALLSLIVLALVRGSRTEVLSTRIALERVQVEALAEAGVNRAILGLLELMDEERWKPDGVAHKWEYSNSQIAISVTDESGKIDINTAPVELLTSLFLAAGQDERTAQTLGDSIADWRDEDRLVRVNGAEERQYRRAGRGYRPRNGAFQSVGELRDVLGMTDELFACISPHLTVFSHMPAPASFYSSGLIKSAMNLRERSKDLAKQTGPVAMEPTGIGSFAGRALTIRTQVPQRNSHDSEKEIALQAVIRLTGNPRDPYWVLDWNYAAASKAGSATTGCFE